MQLVTGGAAGKLIGTLQKDLIKVPDEDLPPNLAEWVKPLRRESW